MSKLRFGVLGAWRGEAFAKLIPKNNSADAEIVAICDTMPERIERAKKEFDLPDTVKYVETYDELLDCGIDVVVLCNFFHEHAKCAIKALERNISVVSDTTAAPTLGECVALCEAAEKSKGKYILAANCPFLYGPMELEKLYNDGSFGRVLYAEGEYFHPTDPNVAGFDNAKHWRKYLPRTYYNMHDMGTLMSITGTMPKKVNAKAIFAPDNITDKLENSGDIASVILTEMDNGAIFRTTSCAGFIPMSKWYRMVCEKGTMETGRTDINEVTYSYADWTKPEDKELTKTYDACPPYIIERIRTAGHGNADKLMMYYIIDCLKGKKEPFFDVYRSVALSAAGILAWRSVLEDGKEFIIPDFKNKDERKAVENDYLTPFPDFENGKDATLPCSSKPYTRPTDE